jgi:hypothetical protein
VEQWSGDGYVAFVFSSPFNEPDASVPYPLLLFSHVLFNSRYLCYDSLVPPHGIRTVLLPQDLDVAPLPLQRHPSALILLFLHSASLLTILFTPSQIFFAFIGLSSFYLAFFFICKSAVSTEDAFDDPFGGAGPDIISIANNVYIAALGVTIICGTSCSFPRSSASADDSPSTALGNKPAGSRWWYMAVLTIFALLFCLAVRSALSFSPFVSRTDASPHSSTAPASPSTTPSLILSPAGQTSTPSSPSPGSATSSSRSERRTPSTSSVACYMPSRGTCLLPSFSSRSRLFPSSVNWH